jgi:phospholipid-translocating ATPase
LISPNYAVTSLYGNYFYLFTSANFWLSLPIVFFLALAPRIIVKAWNFGYRPNDIDTIRYIYKQDPNFDFTTLNTNHSSGIGGEEKHGFSRRDNTLSNTHANAQRPQSRPAYDSRAPSRTDMATGIVSVHRGFDFDAEEGGVAMRRMQSHLSEARASSRNLPRKGSKASIKRGKEAFQRVFSLKKAVQKRPPIPNRSEHGEAP